MPPQPPTPDDKLIDGLVRQLLSREPKQLSDILKFELGVSPRKNLLAAGEEGGGVRHFLGILKKQRKARPEVFQATRGAATANALRGLDQLSLNRVNEISLMRGERAAANEADRLLLLLTKNKPARRAVTDVLIGDLQLVSQEKARRVNLLRRISKILKSGRFARGGIAGLSIGLILLLAEGARRIGGKAETA